MVATFKEYLGQQVVNEEAEFKTRMFRVPVEHLDKLELKIAKANKLAAKLGTKPAKIVMGDRKFEKISQGDSNADDDLLAALQGAKFREFQYLSVEGEVPILAGGWAFVGKLEPHESGTIVKSAPGHKLPIKFQKADPCHCEHCNKTRRRNETFVVKKGNEHVQVGRSCLKDFLGHDHPEKFAQQAEWIYDIEHEMSGAESDGWGGYGGGSYDDGYNTKAALAVAMAAIRRDGFVGSKAPENMVRTSTTMVHHWNPPKHHDPLTITDQDKEDAEATVSWIQNKAKTDKGEFFQNLDKMVASKENRSKYFGYLAAAAMMYQREKGALEARKHVSDGIKSEAIGKEGDKVKFDAEVIGAHSYQRQSYSYYDSGMSQVLTLKTADGKLVKMFTSNMSVQKGDNVSLSGRLGKAEEEKYEKSPFKGKIVTMMAPRTRIEIKETK